MKSKRTNGIVLMDFVNISDGPLQEDMSNPLPLRLEK